MTEKKQEFPYEDIVNLPHHVSPSRSHMSIMDRAAQFSPFAALTGYEDAVEETARLTQAIREMDETKRALLDQKLRILVEKQGTQQLVRVTYFVPDARKAGGTYETIEDHFLKLDPYLRRLIFAGGMEIRLDMVLDMEGDIFREYFPE